MTTTASPFLDIADQLFAAIAAGDVATIERLYAPGCVIWHNFDNVEQAVAQNLATLRWLAQNLTDLRYDEIRRHELADGFLQQHVLRARTLSGVAIEVPACIVATIADGRITRLEEYLDSAHVRPLAGG